MTECYYIFTDGGARGNPGPGGIGIVLQNSQRQVIKEISKFIGTCTNNEAEYTALITGLDAAQKLGIKDIICYLDSELVVKQLNGDYKVKNQHLVILYNKVKIKAKEFLNITFKHIPREENVDADLLVNQALDNF